MPQMTPRPSAAASLFEKVLRAYETQGISYSDVLSQLRRMLAKGCSAMELSGILRRRKLTGKLPEYAQLQALLDEAIAQSAAPAPDANADGPEASVQGAAASVVSMPMASARLPQSKASEEEVAVDLDFEGFGQGPDAPERLPASELDRSVLPMRLRSIEERTPERRSAVDSLRRSYESAKETESAAATRATGLAADLEAARTELQRHQAELQGVLESLAKREATLDRLRSSLGERDAEIAKLNAERASLTSSLEARARTEARLESDLRAERARGETVALELRASQEAARALDALLTRGTVQPTPGSPLPEDLAKPPIARAEPPIARAEAPGLRAGPPPASRVTPMPGSGMGRGVGWTAGLLILLGLGLGWLYAHRKSAPVPTAAAVPSPGSVVRDCSTCPAMTVLPTGRFKQGSATASALEKPLHWVAIARPIAMSTNPITLEDFQQFVAATGRDMQGCDTYDGEWTHQPGSSWEQPGFAQTGEHPVTCVSWNDAAAYAKWLSAKTGHHYRLPSASEWEYAARAGGEADRPWSAQGQDACAGANVADASAARRYPGWTTFPCDDGYVYTAPVGAFRANSFGLDDMLGNVLQWTEDCWHADYAGAPVDGSAWTGGGDCSQHELRGASWFSAPSFARADYRDHFPADYRTSSAGIRLVRDLAP